jgi:hypothetical protein
MRKFVKGNDLVWLIMTYIVKIWGRWGVAVYFHAFLSSALDGDKWSASYPSCFSRGERAPGAPWI